MASIYRMFPKPELYSLYVPGQHTSASFQHIFNIEENQLSYMLKLTSINEEESDVVCVNVSLTLEELKSNVRYHEQGLFSVEQVVATGSFSEEESFPIKKESIVSLFDLTSADRNPRIEKNDSPSFKFPFLMFVPFEDATFKDFTYLVKSPDAVIGGDPSIYTDTITVNAGNTVFNENKTRISLLSTITISATENPTAGDVIDVSVSTTEPNVKTIYIDQISGITNKSEVKLVNGSGSFKILTDTLSSGDEVKVKLGYKSFKSVASYTATLG